MKVRWTIVAISCLTLICAGVIIWRLVHAQINNRQLAKQAAAYRIRAEQGMQNHSSSLVPCIPEVRESRGTTARPFTDIANPPSKVI